MPKARQGSQPQPPPHAASIDPGAATGKNGFVWDDEKRPAQPSSQPASRGGLAPWDEAAAEEAQALFSQGQYMKSKPLLDQACVAGVWEACYDLAEIYEGRGGLPKDYPRALALFSKSCAADFARACSALSDIYAFGAYGVEQNIPRAQELARNACTIDKIPASACVIPEKQQ
jgi:TPR repeat protein